MADAKGDKKKAEPKPAQKKTGKYIADFKRQHKHLFVKAPRNYGIGRAIQPKRDLTRFVKWPRYVRVQRQRAILKQRLKIPPPINHFSKTLEKNQGERWEGRALGRARLRCARESRALTLRSQRPRSLRCWRTTARRRARRRRRGWWRRPRPR
jgi:large subunit ribosomal protein L7Ae